MDDQRIVHNRNHILIILSPTFSNKLNINNYPIEIEYGDLPNNVQQKVLEFFKSKEFIVDQTQNYALDEITAGNNTYPKFNTIINNIMFHLYNKMLLVYLYGILVEIPKDISKHYQPVTLKDYDDNAKEGFWKAIHSGPLTSEYGIFRRS